MNKMTEIYPGFFQTRLLSADGRSIIHIFIIPGAPGERTLMIDAGYRTQENKDVMTRLLEEHGIPFDSLDVFLTHKHHDHTGLATFYANRGARIFMNPEEDRHPYDCIYYNNNPEAMEEQINVLRRVGVTPELNPILWERFMELNREIQRETRSTTYNEKRDYTYIPIGEEQLFAYGDYSLHAFHIKGHTFGQMGLYDPAHRLVFPADQIIDGIVPIVGTSYTDEHLLGYYLRSLENFQDRFNGYSVHPAHGNSFSCSGEVTGRILSAYRKKLDIIQHIVATEELPQTVQAIAFQAYGITQEAGWKDMMQTKMIITKTFSCLEYLYDRGVINRRENEEGTLLWSPRE